MLEILRSIVIGGVQGISEFLPISSSGHLVLIPYIFHWDYQGLSFDVALHFGTVIALIIYFWKDWVNIIANTFCHSRPVSEYGINSSGNPEHGSRITCPDRHLSRWESGTTEQFPKNFLWQIIVATIPAVIVGLLVDKIVETRLHSPVLISVNLIVFGIILWLFDKYSPKNTKLSAISYLQSFIVGIAQSISLMPGVSRAGITISLSRALGLDRKNAARFSFLLATPAMTGAFLLTAKDLSSNDLNISFFVAIISSAIFGYFAIKYLLKYLERGNFAIFVWYRIIIAIIVLGLYYIK